MTTASGSKDTPASPPKVRRFDLIEATATTLRQSILQGDYGRQLMAERPLAQALQVSRATLRSALSTLENEGLLRRSGTRGEREILRSRRRPRKQHQQVRLLQNGRPYCYLGEYLHLKRTINDCVRDLELLFAIETQPACFSGKPDGALERLIAIHPAQLWILHRSNPAMQAWFARKTIPCLLLGSATPDTPLPCMDMDYASLCRHAAGVLLARGHRHLAILHPSKLRLGDETGLTVFHETLRQSSHTGLTLSFQPCDETVTSIKQATDSLLNKKPRPDGWFILGPETYLTVFSYLARCGIAAGQDISLLCRNADPSFHALVPSVAHYQRNQLQIKRHLAHVIKKLLDHRPLKKTRFLIDATFCDGESLRLPTDPSATDY